MPFQIVEISHIWGGAFGEGAEDGVQSPKAARENSDPSEASKQLAGRIDLAVGTPSKKARIAKAIQSVKRSASLQQSRPKAARPLTSGRPVSFRLGPVDTPTIFYGSYSYRLEVPDDASRVIFTLESDDDVALYVRFGEDSIHQDGNLLYDYSDRNRTGNERIVITPRSDPPLRAGTYFASIAVWDTGVVAEGTFTAEVEREGGSPPPTNGGPLTPGQPTPFRLGPVERPSIYNGRYSFRLEVPADATRVIFTLESNFNLALSVRYGEDNTVQDRMVVTDYRDLNPAGNERIVITPRSDPPLRAGTYFASISVFDTSVVAEGTLTAEVELEGEERPMISGGPLTPGQPAPFRLGPVERSTIFYRNYSFRLDAPDIASRIAFTLESVDPDVDVALYVRYGENIVHQDGKLLYDYLETGTPRATNGSASPAAPTRRFEPGPTSHR